jgi:hypothetical protein
MIPDVDVADISDVTVEPSVTIEEYLVTEVADLHRKVDEVLGIMNAVAGVLKSASQNPMLAGILGGARF